MPNWYGIEGIGFEFRGIWSDPLLHYRGRTFNVEDIVDGLWELYIDEGGSSDSDDEWESFVKANAANYLDDIIYVMEGK